MKLTVISLLGLTFATTAFAGSPPETRNNPFARGRTAHLQARGGGGGGVQGGGGDLAAEGRIKTIRDDLRHWIDLGGAAGFDFPGTVTREDYELGNTTLKTYGMKEVLLEGSVVVNVIDEQNRADELANTFVDGALKVCKGIFTARRDGLAYIICDKRAFESMDARNPVANQDLQYRQIHHEYAAPAGIEQNLHRDSDYFLSNQLKRFIGYEWIRRLIVPNSNGYRKFGWVKIPAKDVRFTRGSPANEPGRDSKRERQRTVVLAEDFEMMTTPVTQAQWQMIMG